eukprot:g2408.t1
MLSESAIDRVVGEVRDCHRELIVHGAKVVLKDLVTANRPVTSPVPPYGLLSPQPQTSSSSPSSSPPDVVALHWQTSRPWLFRSYVFKPLLRDEKSWKADFTYFHVDPTQHVTRMDVGEGQGRGPPPADLVVWHVTHRVLELQADTGFTESAVTNTLAREIALGTAKNKLLECVELRLASDESDEAPDDPMVARFMDRFVANLIALVEEASAAPAAFSVSHPLLPDGEEDRLRENVARNRRERADQKEYERLKKEYEAAVEARKKSEAAGEGASAPPAPAGDIPSKPKHPPYDAEPTSPDPLAASLPAPEDAPVRRPVPRLHGHRDHVGVS